MDHPLYGLRHTHCRHRNQLASLRACTSAKIRASCRMESIHRTTIHLLRRRVFPNLLGGILCFLLRGCPPLPLADTTHFHVRAEPLTHGVNRLTSTVTPLPVSPRPIRSTSSSPPTASAYQGESYRGSSRRDGAARSTRPSQQPPWSLSSYTAGSALEILAPASTSSPQSTAPLPRPSNPFSPFP